MQTGDPTSTEPARMSQDDRMRAVIRMLESRDSVSVAELSQTFSVSEVTVRNDFAELARQGLVARVRGGVRALQREQSELAFEQRLRIAADRKRAIARAAASLVEEGEAVALDSSTTAYYLALELRSKREVVVVTNGLLVAAALADAPGITVLVIGGTLRAEAMSLVGDLTTDALRSTQINKGFLGARGLSLDRGLMDLNPDEVRIKANIARACERVIGIVDASKWERTALLSFASTDNVHDIVTDEHAPPNQLQAWRDRGINIITAQIDDHQTPPARPPQLRPTHLANQHTR